MYFNKIGKIISISLFVTYSVCAQSAVTLNDTAKGHLNKFISILEPDRGDILKPIISDDTVNRFKYVSGLDVYATISADVYNDTSTLSSRVAVRIDDSSSLLGVTGFFAAIYRVTDTGQYVLAYRGTGAANELSWWNPKLWNDWIQDLSTDVLLTIGYGSPQHLQAAYFAKKWKNYNYIATGHSLGGGLAQMVAFLNARPAIVFNPAAVPSVIGNLTYRNGSDSQIVRVIVDSEGVAGGSGILGGKHYGRSVRLNAESTSYSAMADYFQNNGDSLRNQASALLADIALKFGSYHKMQAIFDNISSYKLILNYISNRQNWSDWTPIKFDHPTGTVWDQNSDYLVSATSQGAYRISLQALSQNGDVKLTTLMTRREIFNKDGTTAWNLNLQDLKAWKALDSGNYKIRVEHQNLEGKFLYSPSVDLKIQRITVPGKDITGSIQTQLNQSILVGSTVSMSGTASGPAPIKVFVNWTYVTNGEKRREEAVFSVSSNRWVVSREINVAGVYAYQMEVFANGKSVPFGEVGKVTVGEVVIDPRAANVEKISPVGQIKLNEPAQVLFIGQNLNADVRVTVENCINPARISASQYQILHQCTPVVAGLQKASWRANASSELKSAGTINVASLIDGMTFKDEETVPDGSVIPAGSNFTKNWTIHNTGTSTWDGDYCLQPAGGEALSSTPACVVGKVQPNGSYVFSVAMNAPAVKQKATTYKQYWALSKNRALPFGRVFVEIKVNGSEIQPPVPSITANVSPAGVQVGQEMTFSGRLSSDAGVSKVELLFPKYPNMAEAMTSNGGGLWSKKRIMQAADTAPYQVRVTMINGQSKITEGIYTVTQTNVPPPPIPPVPPTPPMANIQGISPSSAAIGPKVRFSVTGSQLAPTIKLLLAGEQCIHAGGDITRRDFDCTNNRANSPKQMTVTTLQGVTLYTQSFTVTNANTPPSPPPPSPDLPINPKLTAGSNITAGVPWTARLTTSVPIYSADIIFNSGKRIPLDGDATNWESRDTNSKFSEAAVYSYTLQIRRRINSQLETYPGGTLEVRPAPIVGNAPRITSALTSEQGKPYNLTVQTSSSADKVTVQWPDASGEQGLGVKDGQRTQWEYGNRAFLKYDPMTLVIKVYKDGVVQPTGQTTGVLTFTPQAASVKLLEIAKNIVIGENRYVTVEASLTVAKVTFQLGNETAFNLTGGGPGSSNQSFRAQVPFKTSGAAVPYTITGYNAQGQAVGNKVTGTVEVKAAGDALKAPNPVPAEINKGQSVSWQFQTTGSPAEMWMEFAAPLNRVNLVGAFLNHAFNYPAGSYSYRLMRKDHLGNIFPIGGASGTLKINDVQVIPPSFTSAIANGQVITSGTKLTFKKSDLISFNVKTNQPLPRIFVMVPAVNADRELSSSDKLNWSNGLQGFAPGTYAAKLQIKDLNYQLVNVPAPLNFTIVIQP